MLPHSPDSPMERLTQISRDDSADAGVFPLVTDSRGLALLFSPLRLCSGTSLRPVVFTLGFVALVALPQWVVHLLDALAQAQTQLAAGTPAAVVSGNETKGWTSRSLMVGAPPSPHWLTE